MKAFPTIILLVTALCIRAQETPTTASTTATTAVTSVVSSISPTDTKCYKLRADTQVSVYGMNEGGTPLPSDVKMTLPAAVAMDPVSRMKFQAEHGFDDVDGDGVERFRFTIICRCHNETNTFVHHIQKAHLGEVDCSGYLTGGRIGYDLGVDRIGQCFVASQRQTRAAAGNLSRFFLELASNATFPSSHTALEPTDAYFRAGTFKLHRYTYHDVCTQDLGMPRGDFTPKALRGGAVRLRPLLDDSAKYVKVPYEGGLIAKTITVA